MATLAEQIEALERDDIQDARRMPGSLKLRAGGDLFDEACRWTLAGIRNDNPGISDADALSELRRRIQSDRTGTEWAPPTSS